MKLLEDEVAAALRKIQKRTYKVVGQKQRCFLCPFRTFERKVRLVTHIKKYHTEDNHFCASGTKQLKCVFAMRDNDMLQSKEADGYLERSSLMLRKTVKPALSKKVVVPFLDPTDVKSNLVRIIYMVRLRNVLVSALKK